jgi:hypothetical protein
MRQRKSDPYLFVFSTSGAPQGIILVDCDDCIMTGIASVMKKLRQGIVKRVTITEIEPFTRHLEVDWKFGADEEQTYLESSIEFYTDSICRDLEAET